MMTMISIGRHCTVDENNVEDYVNNDDATATAEDDNDIDDDNDDEVYCISV